MHLAVVRGAFLNAWEMENYVGLTQKHKVVAFGSKRVLEKPKGIKVRQLWSPMDLPQFPGKMPLLNRLFVDAHYLFGLEQQLRDFDIAHCAETYYHYTQQCLNAKKKGYVKKVVSTVWETIPFNNEAIRGRKEFKKRAIKEVDLFITPTKKAKQSLIKEGCKPHKVIVIRMGVDINKFKVKISSSRVRSGKIVFLFVGRLEGEKGIFELVEAFRLLSTSNLSNLDYYLRIVGSGSLKDRLLSKIKEWGLESFISIKNYSYNQMPSIYQQADIFILPSKQTDTWEEQYGMVLVEAMASGLPIIATASGAIPEVAGNAALLVNPASSLDLYHAMLKLVNNEKLLLNLSAKARKRAEKEYDARKTAKQLEEIYQSILTRQ